MANKGTVLGGAFLLGAVAGMAAAWCFRASDAPPPANLPIDSAATPEADRVVAATVSNGIEPIVARLEEVVRRLAALEAAVAAQGLGGRADARHGTQVSGPVAVDVASLQQALERIEQQKLESLSDEALLRSVSQAMKGDGDVDEALRRLQLLLQRPLKPEQRAEALVQLGALQRTQGSPSSLQASAETLRTVVREQGLGSRFGMDATYQLIWTASKLQNHAEALSSAEAFASSPAASPFQRAQGRWAAAIVLEAAGDRAAARAAYDAWLLQHADAPENAKMAIDVRERRNRL